MDRTTALDHIRLVVEKAISRDLPDFGADTHLMTEVNLDSTAILEVLMDLEESIGFEVDVDSLDPATLQTAGSLADYIAQMTEG
jgi:acyl carrier protein